jgi:hypothetical protein
MYTYYANFLSKSIIILHFGHTIKKMLMKKWILCGGVSEQFRNETVFLSIFILVY